MAWPRGRKPTWNVGRLGDDDPCPSGHVGNFSRGRDGKRKCRTCGMIRVKLARYREEVA